MSKIFLHYYLPGQGTVQEVPSSAEQLMVRMEELRTRFTPMVKMPFSVDLTKNDALNHPCNEYCEHLSVGMGDGGWIIFYWPGYEKGPILYSLGDEKAEGIVEFFFGDATAMSRKYLISRETALDAVRVWCQQGVLSKAVRWTSDIFPAT